MTDHCSECCPNKKKESRWKHYREMIEATAISVTVSAVVVILLKLVGV